jgi:hypothetical protein
MTRSHPFTKRAALLVLLFGLPCFGGCGGRALSGESGVSHPDGGLDVKPAPDSGSISGPSCFQRTSAECTQDTQCRLASAGCPTCENPHPGSVCVDAGLAGQDAGACGTPICRCDGLDETTCAAAPASLGCTPFRCRGCNGAPDQFACLGPSAGAPVCAPCEGDCRTQSDCNAGICFAHGEGGPWCIGACVDEPSTCVTDADCNGGPAQICEPDPCACTSGGSTRCVPGCQSTNDCDEGYECGADHRCIPQRCPVEGSCPTNFFCPGQTVCERKSCSSDAGCEGGFCVLGRCYSEPGQCAAPPPP